MKIKVELEIADQDCEFCQYCLHGYCQIFHKEMDRNNFGLTYEKLKECINSSDICDIYEQFLKCEIAMCDNCPAVKAYQLLDKKNLVEISKKEQSLRGGKNV